MKPLPAATPVQVPGTTALPSWLRAQLEAIFGAIELLSPSCFRFAGGPPVDIGQASSAGSHPLAEALWPLVYTHFYARPSGLSRQGEALQASLVAGKSDPAFVARLSAANLSQSRWDPFWKVYQQGQSGALHVCKGEVFRLAIPGEYAYAGGPGRMPAVGDTVDLLRLRESVLVQPGFYYAFGEAVPSEFDDAQMSRLYFHASPDTMPWLLELVTGGLNRYQAPFRMKCLDCPASYDRADAAVLYVARRFLSITLRLLSARSSELAQRLKPGVPLFTKELSPGVGLADEPGTGESFGQSRARLVCQGIVGAWQRGLSSKEARLQAVLERFAQLGLSLEKPHLSEGMVDAYRWPEAHCDAREAA